MSSIGQQQAYFGQQVSHEQAQSGNEAQLNPQAQPYQPAQSQQAQSTVVTPQTTIYNPPQPAAIFFLAAKPTLTPGTAAYGRNQAQRALSFHARHHKKQTFPQIVEAIERDADSRRGFGLNEQEMGRDREIFRWASLDEDGLWRIMRRPDDH